MGRPILGPAIRLDLDDPADAFRSALDTTDQQGPEHGFGGRQRTGSEFLAGDNRRGPRPADPIGQEEKINVTSEGMIPPKNMSTNGTMVCRVTSAVTEPWSASKIWRTNGNSLGWAICP